MSTFIEDMEALVDIVSDWGVDVVLDSVAQLTKDGRPFGAELRSSEIQMEDYMKLRGNPEAFAKHIDSKARDLITQLTEEGIAEEDIASIHPYDIAIKFAIDWSYDMEKKLNDTAIYS